MRPEQIWDEVNRLNFTEKLLLVEDVWDSIVAENSDIPIPMWQKQELDKRYQDFQKGHLELHEWSDIHGDLRQKHT
jgi:putative addiction module component (TIGR02574 family)